MRAVPGLRRGSATLGRVRIDTFGSIDMAMSGGALWKIVMQNLEAQSEQLRELAKARADQIGTREQTQDEAAETRSETAASDVEGIPEIPQGNCDDDQDLFYTVAAGVAEYDELCWP